MTIESDTLKTLQAIQKHLEAASRTTGRMGGGSRQDTADERKQDSDDKKNNKIIVGTIKNIDSLGTAAHNASQSLQGLDKNAGKTTVGLGDLSVELNKTITQFTSARGEIGKISIGSQMSALQEAVESAAESIKKTRVGTIDTTRAVIQLGKLDQTLENQVIPRLGSFRYALQMATSGLVEIWDDLKEERKDTGMKELGKSVSIAITALSRKGGIGYQLELMTRLLRDVNKQLRTLKSGVGGIGGGGGGGGGRPRFTADDDGGSSPGRGSSTKPQGAIAKFFKPITSFFSGALRDVFANASQSLGRNIVNIIDDAYQVTAARGYGTTDSIVGLYKNAALAGMSLREYAQLMDENMAVVARSTSFEEFDKRLDAGRDSLAKLGTFGIEATQLTASMQNSAVTLGVPMKDLGKTTQDQISIYGTLQKSIGMASDKFQELVLMISENEAVQKELLGLDSSERSNRLKTITQTAAWAKSLGMGDRATRELTDALLAQRKSTVKERFNQRGRLTQAFALAGFSGDQIDEVQTLASKRNRTTEEDQRFTELLGQYAQRAEAAKQSGEPGTQYQFEAIDEKLSEVGIKPLLDAAGQARAAQQAGTTAPGTNADLGKTLGRIEIAIGKAITFLEGISKSPAALAGIAAVVAGVTALGSIAYLRTQAALIGQAVAAALRSMNIGGPGLPGGGVDAGDAGKAAGKGKWAGRAASVGSALLLSAPAILNGISSLMDLTKAQEDKKQGKEGANEAEGKAIGEGIGGTAGAAIGLVLSGFIGAFTGGLGLAATGIITSITTGLGAWAGGLLGGWLKKDTVTEKNTKELAKNQAELQKNTQELIDKNRAGAGAAVVPMDKLGALSTNVLQTAKAFSAPTDAELQKYAESKMTPEEREAAKKAKAQTPQAAVAAEPTVEEQYYDPMTGLPIGGYTTPVSSQKIATIAAPAPQVRASVNPADVNKATPEVQPTEPQKTQVQSTAQTPPVQDAASILAQILKVLQDSLIAENQQVDLTSQLIRAQNTVRLPDNYAMTRLSLSQG